MEVETPVVIARPRAKHWAGCTLNNYTPLDIMTFAVAVQPLADYYVYGKEVGENGTPHLQFMVCFKKQMYLSQITKLFQSKPHWEIKHSKSSMKRASDYCKKGIGILNR